jgi:hypothetical protein
MNETAMFSDVSTAFARCWNWSHRFAGGNRDDRVEPSQSRRKGDA